MRTIAALTILFAIFPLRRVPAFGRNIIRYASPRTLGSLLPVLHILAVHPSYQRRGLGAILIRPGLEAADKAGAKTFIEAFSFGLPLYLKHGWEPVDEMVIDIRPHGGHKVTRQKLLIREPKAGNKEGKVDVRKVGG